MNPAAEQIRQQLSMFDVLEFYGFPTAGNGRIPCPLHEGKDRNFAYKKDVFKCFVCGRSGSVIDFVMQLFHLSFAQAVVRLDNDFRLGLARPAVRVARGVAARRTERERARREWDAQYDALLSRYARLDRVVSRYRPTERTAPAYAAAMAKLEYLWYAIEEMRRQKDGG